MSTSNRACYVSMNRVTQRHLVCTEGSYEDIDEWEREEITKVEAPSTMWVTVHGPPRSKSGHHVAVVGSIDDILVAYLRDMDAFSSKS